MLTNETVKASVKQNKILKWLGYTSLFIIAVGIGLVLYWLNAPEDVLHLNKPIVVQPPTTSAESTVYMDFDYCKTQAVSGTFSRRIFSDRQEVLNQTGVPENTPSGCVHVQQPLLLPRTIEAGTYRVKYVINYQLNPLKSVSQTLISEPFTVK